ncbi:site-specific integrase [Bacteroides nordii]|uniref:site-specific integrase n=1 Tax=Bacteroides nordii TaxID=291645 RepID=UPI0021E6B7A0|nr:site-specific integrase [Bacteroides nordii]
MKNVRFILWTHQAKSDGTFPIRLRITKDRKVKYLSFGLSAALNQWNPESERFKRDRRINPEYEKYNSLLNEYARRSEEIIDEFNKNRVDWTLNQFEDQFFNKARRGKVEPYFIRLISDLRSTGHLGNANCYDCTLHMLELYDSKFHTRVFSEIDIKYVKGFDIWMQKPRRSLGKGEREIQRDGCSGNTRKYYLKALRAVLNRAIQENEASAVTYPFGKGGFEIAKLEEETPKRYLPSEYLERIKGTPGKTFVTEIARRMFLFSYYCYGISFIDMAQLTRRNIIRHEAGEYIVYKRQKTKGQKRIRPIQIKVTNEISGLLDWFNLNACLISPYLVPVVSRSGYSGEKLYNHIRGRYKKYLDALKRLAEEIGIEGINLTSYVSRHTMAMTLQGNNVPREVISQILGHSDLETTNTYLDSFGSSVIDEAVKVL